MAAEVSIDQLTQARRAGALVIDVRDDDEYAWAEVGGQVTTGSGQG